MTEKINRRKFFSRIAGASVLMATSSLPIIAEDNPSLFPKRGKDERLSVNYIILDIGLKKPFSVMHISDTHLTATYPNENDKKQQLHKIRTTTFGGRQEEALRDSLDWAKKRVDYVIHTGDIVDWQSEANFDLVKKYFGDAIIVALGNHEYSPDMWLSEPKITSTETHKDLSRQMLSKVFSFDLSFHTQVINGVNFIAIDDAYDTVTPMQVRRFQTEVKRGLPIILCMHVPFYTDNIWRASTRYWSSGDGSRFSSKEIHVGGAYQRQKDDPTTRDFIAYLKKEPLLKGILAGHEHITVQDWFSPTAKEYIVGGNFQFFAQEILFM